MHQPEAVFVMPESYGYREFLYSFISLYYSIGSTEFEKQKLFNFPARRQEKVVLMHH